MSQTPSIAYQLRNLVNWNREEHGGRSSATYESSNGGAVSDDAIEEAKLLGIGAADPQPHSRTVSGASRRIRSRKRLIYWGLAVTAVVGLLYLSKTYWSSGSIPTVPGVSNIHTGNKRKALVLASWSEQDVAWLSGVPEDWEIFRYVLDEPFASPGHYVVPRNQGREAMAYITFIIDNWGALPEYTVFAHGHDRSWHQVEPVPWKLAALNFTALDMDDYINLRCTIRPGCSEKTYIDATHVHDDEWRIQAKLMPGFWQTMFPEELDYWGIGPPPTAIGVPCCAQFAVTRTAIELRPREFWEMYRKPLERDLEEFRDSIGEGLDWYTVGMLYEKVWHILFGKPAIYCPLADYCRGTQFSDAMTCDWYPELYEESAGWENVTCVWKNHDSGSTA